MNTTIKVYEFFSIDELKAKNVFYEIQQGNVVVVKASSNYFTIENLKNTYLTEEEIRKMNQYCREIDRVNFNISHSVVNYLFAIWLYCDSRFLSHEVEKFSKPYISNNYHISFNISHTNGCVVVAFFQDSVGIDVEFLNLDFDYTDIIKASFSKKEQEFVGERHYRFFEFWVAKEAYFKYLGTGLYKDLKDVYVAEIIENRIYLWDKKLKKKQLIKLFTPYPKFLAGLCIKNEEDN